MAGTVNYILIGTCLLHYNEVIKTEGNSYAHTQNICYYLSEHVIVSCFSL